MKGRQCDPLPLSATCAAIQKQHDVFHECAQPVLCAQIMTMSTMKDYERLELLKEIGGTKVYEERRSESLKILQETANRRQRILEVVWRPVE